MSNFFIIEKRIGETPLEALERLRFEKSIDKSIKMTYAGRLDPLASGKMLILIGEECKKKDKYLGLDKEYEFEVLWGISTDSADTLGIIKQFKSMDKIKIYRSDIKTLIGKHNWYYPIFSSKTVNGKPLFEYAIDGKVNEIKIPKKEIEIYKLKHISTRRKNSDIIKKTIFDNIAKISKQDPKKPGNDFRRDRILKSWDNFFGVFQNESFFVSKFRATVSSGTYIRVLTEKIAEIYQVPATTLSITRLDIGEVQKKLGFIFWKDKF